MNEKVKTLKKWVQNSNNIVFFGGAGVSTESGIPDFRSVDGLYHTQYKYPPEKILSHSFFFSHMAEFYQFYFKKMIYLDAKPNITHVRLSEWENQGKLKAVVTQNIDGLHQKAGCKNVYELHGSIHRNYCLKCNRQYDIQFMTEEKGIPSCSCGGIVKPDVVLYEEALNQEILEKSVEVISKAEILIIGGTSLSVYPASGLIRYYKGNKLVLINKESTQYDNMADLFIQDTLGNVFKELV